MRRRILCLAGDFFIHPLEKLLDLERWPKTLILLTGTVDCINPVLRTFFKRWLDTKPTCKCQNTRCQWLPQLVGFSTPGQQRPSLLRLLHAVDLWAGVPQLKHSCTVQCFSLSQCPVIRGWTSLTFVEFAGGWSVLMCFVQPSSLQVVLANHAYAYGKQLARQDARFLHLRQPVLLVEDSQIFLRWWGSWPITKLKDPTW